MSVNKTSNINQNICGICSQNPSKYCCPRCDVFYCSLDCYRAEKHSECSENFYRNCVNNELMSLNADDESRAKMIDILKRAQDDDNINIDDLIEYDDSVDSDDEADIDLQERLKGLNLDNADAVWNALTEDEKNEFEALMNQGDVDSILPRWEPWWIYHREKKMVEVMTNDDKDRKTLKQCPELKIVPKFESLTSVKPSSAIKNNITNVLASYAFIMRYFNGELESKEAIIYLLDICDNLDANANFEDPAIAIESTVQKCIQSALIKTNEASLNVMKNDTFHIIRGPSEENSKHYCKAALSHLHCLLSEAKTLVKAVKPDNAEAINKNSFSRKFPEHQAVHLPNLDVSKIKRCIKKIEYYLSYIESFNMDFE